MRFFTSDTHFGHARINELSGRPFTSVEDMNENIIANWNAVVGSGDIVFHLGDVALGTIAESLPLVARLNGHKILIPGNHDRIFAANKQSQIDRFLPIYEQYFVDIWSSYGSFLRLNNEATVWLSHFPASGDSHTDDRFPEYRPKGVDLPIVHGHIHELWKKNGNQFNVGVDVNNFFPVSEDEIIDWVRSL